MCTSSGSLSSDGRLRTFCIMGQRLTYNGKLNRKGRRRETESEMGALVVMSRPETERSIHGQGEGQVTLTGGPNPLMLKNEGMSCGSE